ncbi:hypothetical protein [Halomarina rubra]|uniref:Small CPxCG-related zinc finger protein n=1 Tax=Halomarina rubra TaxID=2071873 RepID=A0ABD6ATD2_9EURY|nr:hypothetical protein [Halomarina rubra]
MSVSVRVDCPTCSTAVVAEPDESGEGDTLHGRSVACDDCGHRIDVYYY